jgi:hypothetical protein
MIIFTGCSHNDFLKSNILVCPDHENILERVLLIDFGKSTKLSHHIFNIINGLYENKNYQGALNFIFHNVTNNDGKKIIVEDRESNASFKKCTPMLDMLSSGYIVPLWTDVQVTIENNLPLINWRTKKNVFELHNGQEVEIPYGYHKTQFKYLNQWTPRLPKGYSALIIPCPGYPNTPFKSMHGIIDYDKSPHPLLPPVYLKNNFEGIVEKGTPMFQIIPFKRNNWQSSFSFLEEGEIDRLLDRDIKSTLVNNYVKNFWEKKSYK